MRILVLDTETLGLANPTVYELGYLVYDTADGNTLVERDYVIKQVYDNIELFNTAYYANKRPIYENNILDGNCKKVYWGSAMNILAKDISRHKVDGIYAYNSRFDTKAIAKTCAELNAKVNPTADGIDDIMNYIKDIVKSQEFINYCNENNYLTKHKTPQPRRTAEVVYKYLANQPDFEEAHMALSDSQIELYILLRSLGLILV